MGIARTFQNIRLFNTMTVEDNVKVGLHNQERYSGFEGVLRLPTYWKHEKAAHERDMELLSSSPMRSFSRLLSNVRTCSRSTMESFASPQEAALSEICVGSLDLSFWLVIAAAITVGLCLFPTSF